MKFEKISRDNFIKALKKYQEEENLSDYEVEQSIKYFDNDFKLPTRGTVDSAGYDFYNPVVAYRKDHVIKIPTGVKVKLDTGTFLMAVPRSSSYKNNYELANTIGIVDKDYYNNSSNEGHIYIMLRNFGNQNNDNREKLSDIGDRLIQGIILKYSTTEDDTTTEVRNGGYGSTGK